MSNLAKVYGKPLVKGVAATPERALKLLKQDILQRVRAKLLQSTFSDRAKKAFSRSLSVKIGSSSLTIRSSHPAFILLLRGQRKGQMTWLVKARAPIPIITDTGELIFRTASARSMLNGKWIHPGRGPFDFVEKAKAEAKARIRKGIMEEIRRTVAQSARQNGRTR